MQDKLFIETRREGYAPNQCRDTMTIKELVEFLKKYDDGTLIYLKNDNGYTFGAITENSFTDDEE